MPTPKRVQIWPIVAVRDAKQPPARHPDEVLSLINCYAQDTEVGSLVVGRPGFAKIGAQLGSGSDRKGQLAIQFTKRSGTTFTVVICGGKFYTYDWSGDAFTEVIDATDLSGASITLSTSARCYGVVFADQLIVSDGVNTPFAWDGTSHGGLTKLTNWPVIYGKPFVYYGKAGGIKNTARSTIVWTEEGLINTGLEAGGYNNAWDLIQSKTEGLTAICASNDAIYYARQNSVGAITGAVTTDFQTTGTREAVSESFGTLSPDAFEVVDNQLVFVDQYGSFRAGGLGGVQEIGEGSRETMAAIAATNYPNIQFYDDPETGHLKFAIPEGSNDYPSFTIWLDRQTGRYASMERGYAFYRVGVVLNGSGFPTVLHIGGASALEADTGYVYQHGHPRYGTLWSDGFAAGGQGIAHQMETDYVAADTIADKIFTRGELSVLLHTDLSQVRLTHITPRGESEPLTLTTMSGGGAVLGAFVLGTDKLASVGGETKRTWTTRQHGRWCKLRFTHGVTAERFAVSELALHLTPVSTRAGVR